MRALPLLSVLAMAMGVVSLPASAQTMSEPVPGEVIFVPYPFEVSLDGDVSEWSSIEPIVVTEGPSTSDNPAENGSFDLRVAADDQYLYVTATMPDATIVTGQHGTDYYNEDSLEFYVNFTSEFDLGRYEEGIHQIRIIPGDIGNTDPTALTITGSNAAAAGTIGYVFETADGWGFEVAVPFPAGVTPTHGLALGFQAHANGSSGGDRNVKLIWSSRDENDLSYTAPGYFGLAILATEGEGEPPIPERGEVGPAVEVEPAGITLNQAGYRPEAKKIAAFVSEAIEPVEWRILNQTGRFMAEGVSEVFGFDEKSGGVVHLIDFSELSEIGEGFRIEAGEFTSVEFSVAEDPYSGLARDAFRYFYLSRSGIELDPKYAGIRRRPAGHLTDDGITCFSGVDSAGNTWPGCDYTIDGAGGWYDAGDYGKYTVNTAYALWVLMNLYEYLPSAILDREAGIPEGGNGIPDLLDEIKWGMEWLLSMQVPQGEPQAGMAHHKLHDLSWSGLPSMPATEFDNDPENLDPANGRYVYPPSTIATLDLAAAAAQCSRVFADADPDLAARCLVAAERAWTAALEYPNEFTGSVPGSGGGDYADTYAEDEKYWAATELWLSTGNEGYAEAMVEASAPLTGARTIAAFQWPDTVNMGVISRAVASTDEADREEARQQVIALADYHLAIQDTQPFGVPLSELVWGSNGDASSVAVVFALAHDLSGEIRYLEGLEKTVDYLLGRNPSGISFVTKYGARSASHPHHRFWAGTESYPLPPPGVLVGGPNESAADQAATDAGLADMPAGARYVDNIESYSTNEVAINWQAPWVWITQWMEAKASGENGEEPGPGSSTIPEPSESDGADPEIIVIIGVLVLGLAAGTIFEIRRRRNGDSADEE